jgi:hypothetical protein
MVVIFRSDKLAIYGISDRSNSAGAGECQGKISPPHLNCHSISPLNLFPVPHSDNADPRPSLTCIVACNVGCCETSRRQC